MRIGSIFAVAAVLLATGAAAHAGDDLDRFGRWVDSKRYGEVWVPKVRIGWSPTSNGTYRQADSGEWYWVSADPFWSTTSRDGRWLKDRGEKWVWKPGLAPEPTGEGPDGGIVPIGGYGGPALSPRVARAREARYERTVRDLPLVAAPMALPPLPPRNRGGY